jgi:hypothetical protein
LQLLKQPPRVKNGKVQTAGKSVVWPDAIAVAIPAVLFLLGSSMWLAVFSLAISLDGARQSGGTPEEVRVLDASAYAALSMVAVIQGNRFDLAGATVGTGAGGGSRCRNGCCG